MLFLITLKKIYISFILYVQIYYATFDTTSNYFCLLATELLEPGHIASEAKNSGFISS